MQADCPTQESSACAYKQPQWLTHWHTQTHIWQWGCTPLGVSVSLHSFRSMFAMPWLWNGGRQLRERERVRDKWIRPINWLTVTKHACWGTTFNTCIENGVCNKKRNEVTIFTPNSGLNFVAKKQSSRSEKVKVPSHSRGERKCHSKAGINIGRLSSILLDSNDDTLFSIVPRLWSTKRLSSGRFHGFVTLIFSFCRIFLSKSSRWFSGKETFNAVTFDLWWDQTWPVSPWGAELTASSCQRGSCPSDWLTEPSSNRQQKCTKI